MPTDPIYAELLEVRDERDYFKEWYDREHARRLELEQKLRDREERESQFLDALAKWQKLRQWHMRRAVRIVGELRRISQSMTKAQILEAIRDISLNFENVEPDDPDEDVRMATRRRDMLSRDDQPDDTE